MLFLVAKHLLPAKTVQYRGRVYALRTQPKQRIRFPSRPTAPPVPGVPEPDPAEAIQEGVIPLSGLPRTKWKHKMTHKDIEENGVVVKRQGLTVLEGELFWKGKFRQPPVTLEFTWEYTLDPKTGKYFLTHAELEDGSSHVLVDEHGKPTSLAGALFTIRHALGKNPTEPPPNLEQRFARYVKYDGYVYQRASTDDEHLYHVTYVNQLPGIASAGLNPGAGGSFGGGYTGDSTGRIFWTEPGAIGFWMERKGNMAEHASDNPVADGLIPIVLRTYEPPGELYDDEAGSQDAPDMAYYTEEQVDPSELEVWNGHTWIPVAQANVDSLTKQVYDASDVEVRDGVELVYMDSEHFLP